MNGKDSSGRGEFDAESQTDPDAAVSTSQSVLRLLAKGLREAARNCEEIADALPGLGPIAIKRLLFEGVGFLRQVANDAHEAARIVEGIWRKS